MRDADLLGLLCIPCLLMLGAGVCGAQENLFKPAVPKDLSRALDSTIVDGPLGRGAVGAKGGDKAGPKSDKQVDQPKDATEITAMASNFDNKRHIAIFVGRVTVNDPQFILTCDRLTAHLKDPGAAVKGDKGDKGDKGEKGKGAEAKAGKAAVAEGSGSDSQKAGAGGVPAGGATGGLEKAVAEADPGKLVHIVQEKKEPNGTVSRSVGEGRMAVYVTATEEVTLTGMPWIQQGLNTVVALDETTVMVLTKDGRMSVQGPHKSVIKDSGAEKPQGR